MSATPGYLSISIARYIKVYKSGQHLKHIMKFYLYELHLPISAPTPYRELLYAIALISSSQHVSIKRATAI